MERIKSKLALAHKIVWSQDDVRCLVQRVAISSQSGYFIVIYIQKLSIVGACPVAVALRPPQASAAWSS